MNAAVGILIALPILGYLFSSWKGTGWQKWTTLGEVETFPKGRLDWPPTSNPFRTPLGRLLGRHPMLGSPSRRWKLHRVRHQLQRPSGMPRPLVPRIAALHVSLSWRGLLRRRNTRCRTASSRTLQVRISNRRQQTGSQSRPSPNPSTVRLIRGPATHDESGTHEKLSELV